MIYDFIDGECYFILLRDGTRRDGHGKFENLTPPKISTFSSSLWLRTSKLMLINLRIMPYESRLIDIVARIMSLFFCHTETFGSFCTK